MRQRHPLDRSHLAGEIDLAPVGELGHGQARHGLEGRLVVDDLARQDAARLGHERQPLLGGLGLRPGGALRLVGPGSLDGLCSLAGHGQEEPAVLGIEVPGLGEGERHAADRPPLQRERDAGHSVVPRVPVGDVGESRRELLPASHEHRLPGPHRLGHWHRAVHREGGPGPHAALPISAPAEELEALAVGGEHRHRPGVGSEGLDGALHDDLGGVLRGEHLGEGGGDRLEHRGSLGRPIGRQAGSLLGLVQTDVVHRQGRPQRACRRRVIRSGGE